MLHLGYAAYKKNSKRTTSIEHKRKDWFQLAFV